MFLSVVSSVSKAIGHVRAFSLPIILCASACIIFESQYRNCKSVAGSQPVLLSRNLKSLVSLGSESIRRFSSAFWATISLVIGFFRAARYILSCDRYSALFGVLFCVFLQVFIMKPPCL